MGENLVQGDLPIIEFRKRGRNFEPVGTVPRNRDNALIRFRGDCPTGERGMF